MSEKLAAIRIRGQAGLKKEIKDTLDMLNLSKKHFCTVYPDISHNQ